MELRQIKDLMAAMSRHGVKRLKFEHGDVRLELEQSDGINASENAEHRDRSHITMETGIASAKRSLPAAGESPMSDGVSEGSAKKEEKKRGDYVTSPIVGTFYSSPSPEDRPFVKPGDVVEPHTVICIVEAMKVMNEVKAGMSGVVEEIMVDSAHPVEFGTKLFRITRK